MLSVADSAVNPEFAAWRRQVNFEPTQLGGKDAECHVTSRSETGNCSSPSTIVIRFAISISPTSARKTTPAPGRAGLAFMPTCRAPANPNSTWTGDESWQVRQRYIRDTLTTSVSLDHAGLKLSLYCNDTVDFHRNIFVRKIKVRNSANHERHVRIFHHQDFNMLGNKVGDTAYFDPELRSIVHYRAQRYLMVGFWANGEQRIDEYATGTSGFRGAEGTWRDAEDGRLEGNPIAQGSVDSTIAHHMTRARRR